MHFQKNNPQGKLVHVLKGEVFDVVVDIRRDSKTFGNIGNYGNAGSSFNFNIGGAVWDAGGNHVKQKFDDVRVWNIAKTQGELQAAMNMELVGNEAGLIGYWKFDEGAAGGNNTGLPSSIEDSSPNDNAGTSKHALFDA